MAQKEKIQNKLSDGKAILRPEMYVMCENKKQMLLAIQIALTDRLPTGWKISQRGHLEFWRHHTDRPEINKFPAELTAQQSLDIAWQWLESADYTSIAGAEPDTDGSTDKGYAIYTFYPFGEDGSPYEWHLDYFGPVFAVAPSWLVYGK